MSSLNIIPALPFWILGVPFVVALISWLRMPKQSDLTHADGSRHHNR
jgi:hypothetical protein